MKKKEGLTIKINLTNRWLYTFIVIGILAIIGVGVYAYGTSTPATFGHSIGEMNWQSGIISKLNVTNLCIGTDCRTSWPGGVVAVYRVNSTYCAQDYGMLSADSTCYTRVCSTSGLTKYYTCTGTCSPNIVPRCNNVLQGYLVN
jgi:hypothetical protein